MKNDLTSRDLNIFLKHGWTMQMLCEKYECTQEEFEKNLNEILVPKAAQAAIKKIKSNDKKAKNCSKRSEDTNETVAEIIENLPSSDVEQPAFQDETETLEQLTEKAEMLSNTLIDYEKAYYEGCHKRVDLSKEYKKYRDEMLELKALYEAKSNDARKCIEKDAKVVEEMNRIVEEHEKMSLNLEEIRDKISEMSKVSLFVYSSGEIAAEDDSISLDDSGNEETFMQLRERKEAEDFRLRDLKTVARLIEIIKHLGTKVEILFDEPEVEAAYEMFRT